MRVGLAEGPALPQAKVLVLGERHVTEIIAKELNRQGLEPVFSDFNGSGMAFDRIPAPSDPNALSQLKKLFMQFQEHAGKPGAGTSHSVHPGVSVWAERAEFPLIAQELGLIPICPPVRVLSLFSNKLNLLQEADRLGIPHLVMSFDPIQSIREIEALIKRNKGRFPFILKSLRGGGGFGCFVLTGPEDLEKRVPLWIEQLRHNFGEAMLFAERYAGSSRHIFVPFARFRDGKFQSFPTVDASLQNRYRKIVEFSPPEGLEESIGRSLQDWTEKLADQCAFVGVGGLEFLVDGPKAYLVEGIARLNTSFHLWEQMAGTSAVAWQLATLGIHHEKAVLPKIAPERSYPAGVALRLYAEDPVFQLPQPGFVHEISEKKEWNLPGSRVELCLSLQPGTHLGEGYTGILGSIFVGAKDRKEALTIARGILDELWISGSLSTNERYLSELLNHPWIQENMFYAGYSEEEFIPEIRPPVGILELAVSICAQHFGVAGGPEKWIGGDQWVTPKISPQWAEGPVSFSTHGRLNERNHFDLPGISGKVELPEGPKVRVEAFPITKDKWQVRVGRWVMAVRRVVKSDVNHEVRKGERKLLAQANGRVHSILFRENSPISAHESVLILDCLGVLVSHALPLDAKITKWKIATRDTVHAGQELALFSLIS